MPEDRSTKDEEPTHGAALEGRVAVESVAPGPAAIPREAGSGLAPWTRAELPVPPFPTGLGWLGAVGPGVIILGAAIGGGEFLLGPAVFVQYGLSLLWVTGIGIVLQTIFNTEVMRYTLATGEPLLTGFMRTRPSSTLWAWVYTFLFFLGVGWPAWAATAAGAIYFLIFRQMPGPADAAVVYYIGVGTFLGCVAVLLVGRRIERTLEILNWMLVTCILGGLLILAVAFVPLGTWLGAVVGFAGFDAQSGSFDFMPQGVDFFLLAALVAYSGAGGMSNVVLSNWARDKGYGMSQRAGYIPALIGGQKVNLAHSGATFTPDAEAMRRWRGWWRIVRADQWGVFCVGAFMGMALPALLYVTFLPRGSDIRGLGISAALAGAIGEQTGPLLAGAIAFLGAWLLFKSQLDLLEGMVRAVTDMLWTGSRRLREWRGGDVRIVYYAVLACIVLWGVTALRLAQPVILLQLGANVAAATFVITSLHLLYVNTRLLPPALRPPRWRRVMLVVTAMFYGFFVALSLSMLL